MNRTGPTDAMRAKARELLKTVCDDGPCRSGPCACADFIAAALAETATAARAAALEEAVQYVQQLTETQSTIRRRQTADAIRALKGDET